MARAAGRSRGWAALGGLAALALVKGACVAGTDAPEAVSPEVRAVLEDTWPRVVEPALARVADEAVALEDATRAWEQAARDGGDASAAQASAQEAWRATMAAWQEAELLQLGPAGSSLRVTGGVDLRDRVYSWPTVNRCRVDQETVAGAWDSPDFMATSLVNVLGLDALEVLLFSPEGENGCPGQVDINASGAWDALGPEGVQSARAAYARALAAQVRTDVDALVAAWAPSAGDFAGTLTRAGAAGSPYESSLDAVNAIFDALFYLEEVTKDQKLGYALGNGDCTGGGASCLGQVEGPLAGGSHLWVAANLRGFRALYTGGGSEGQGLEDLLRASGEGALADEVLVALDAADAAAAAVTSSLPVAVDQDRAAVEALQMRVDVLCDLFRLDVAAVLALRVPAEAAGDND
jgi:predicted lipoprotein